ncbi:MAG: hypothetical protein AMXMBFR23_11310 [Chloroflexota bacterium]
MTSRASAAAAWAERHLDALYERAGPSTIVRVRSTDVPTPRVHLLRTAHANYGLVAASVPEDVTAAIRAMLAAEPVTTPDDWETTPPRCAPAIRALLGQPVAEYRGPAFAFPAVLSSMAPPAGFSIEVLSEPRGVVTAPLVEWVRRAKPEEEPVVVAEDRSGVIVGVCHAARRSASAAEAGLEVDPVARGRGLGVALSLAWASAVREGRREPLYSTSWANAASRAVAGRLVLVLMGEDWHVR